MQYRELAHKILTGHIPAQLLGNYAIELVSG